MARNRVSTLALLFSAGILLGVVVAGTGVFAAPVGHTDAQQNDKVDVQELITEISAFREKLVLEDEIESLVEDVSVLQSDEIVLTKRKAGLDDSRTDVTLDVLYLSTHRQGMIPKGVTVLGSAATGAFFSGFIFLKIIWRKKLGRR